jgi:hypothetical protein
LASNTSATNPKKMIRLAQATLATLSEFFMSDIDDRKTGDIMNPAGIKFEIQSQGFDCIHTFHYQTAQANPAILEAYCYTDRLSYFPGEVVSIHASATAPTVDFTIFRDGASVAFEAAFKDIAAVSAALPQDFYSKGCNWPVALLWTIPDDAASGFYVIRIRAERAGVMVEHEHGICVRRSAKAQPAAVALLLSTCTWAAYNDWGGINNYVGAHPPAGFHFAPRLSIHRPYGRGFIWQPKGAPRIVDEGLPGLGDTTRYQSYEWAYAKGFSKFYSGAGWATYERNFALWAEREGISLDYITQQDLHADPAALAGHDCLVNVGHCEYWSAQMRDAIDAWVERGGNVARFAGNFGWQIRLEDRDAVQVCFKELAHESDPVAKSGDTRLITSLWEDPATGRPGSLTFGLQAIYGIYSRVGAAAPRGSGGFVVYRPEHWAFADADLYYGDTFGSSARIFGFEVDGLDHEFRDGLPYPVQSPDVPPGLEILAMNAASPVETDHRHPATRLFIGETSLARFAQLRYGDTSPSKLEAARRGNGMIVSFKQGAGEVFHAGSSEWINGLRLREPFTEAITRTVIRRLSIRSG